MNTWKRWMCRVSAVALGVALLGLTSPAAAQNETGWDEWEYEPDEGLHKEEWYDPGDWFTDPGEEGISYERDLWDTGGDMDYGWHYEPATDEWDYGWHYDYYTDDWYDDEGWFDDWYGY